MGGLRGVARVVRMALPLPCGRRWCLGGQRPCGGPERIHGRLTSLVSPSGWMREQGPRSTRHIDSAGPEGRVRACACTNCLIVSAVPSRALVFIEASSLGAALWQADRDGLDHGGECDGIELHPDDARLIRENSSGGCWAKPSLPSSSASCSPTCAKGHPLRRSADVDQLERALSPRAASALADGLAVPGTKAEGRPENRIHDLAEEARPGQRLREELPADGWERRRIAVRCSLAWWRRSAARRLS